MVEQHTHSAILRAERMYIEALVAKGIDSTRATSEGHAMFQPLKNVARHVKSNSELVDIIIQEIVMRIGEVDTDPYTFETQKLLSICLVLLSLKTVKKTCFGEDGIVSLSL